MTWHLTITTPDVPLGECPTCGEAVTSATAVPGESLVHPCGCRVHIDLEGELSVGGPKVTITSVGRFDA